MIVKLKDIKKSFDSTEVIKGLNLEINSGELISLLGPSGCGKSTTLFMLAGLEDVTSGNILFDNEDVTNLSADKRGIGLVFQNYALYPHFSVLQNVMYPILNKKVSKEEAKEQALKVIKSVNLEDHVNKLPSALSGGQQQRVAIARALAKKPNILLLDEPISNLDAKLKEKTIKEIRDIQKEFNITTVFVTHDQQEALSVSDRIVILDQGVIQQVGTPQELYRNPSNLYVAKFIGTPSINTFDVEVKDGLVIGLEEVIDTKLNIKDGKYTIGIRPENFSVSSSFAYKTNVIYEEILGRDLLIRTKLLNKEVSIIQRNNLKDSNDKSINIQVNKDHILIFDNKTGNRIYEK